MDIAHLVNLFSFIFVAVLNNTERINPKVPESKIPRRLNSIFESWGQRSPVKGFFVVIDVARDCRDKAVLPPAIAEGKIMFVGS